MPVAAAAASMPLAEAMERSGWAIWLVRVSTLSAGLRSPRLLVTVERLAIEPGIFAWTTIVAVALEPFGSKPMVHRTTPAALESVPWLLVAETKLTFVGRIDCRNVLTAG